MGFFKQLQGSEIVAFDKKVHLPAVVDKKAFFFRQHGKIVLQGFVNALAVFFKYKSVLFALDVLGQFIKILQKSLPCFLFTKKGAFGVCFKVTLG